MSWIISGSPTHTNPLFPFNKIECDGFPINTSLNTDLQFNNIEFSGIPFKVTPDLLRLGGIPFKLLIEFDFSGMSFHVAVNTVGFHSI